MVSEVCLEDRPGGSPYDRLRVRAISVYRDHQPPLHQCRHANSGAVQVRTQRDCPIRHVDGKHDPTAGR